MSADNDHSENPSDKASGDAASDDSAPLARVEDATSDPPRAQSKAQRASLNDLLGRILIAVRRNRVIALLGLVGTFIVGAVSIFGYFQDRTDNRQTTVIIEGNDQAARDERAALAENQRLILARLETTQSGADALAAGIPEAVIIELARRITDDISNVDDALVELERAVAVAIEVRQSGLAPDTDSAFVNDVLAQIAERFDAGDLNGAASAAEAGLANYRNLRSQRQAAADQEERRLIQENIRFAYLQRDADRVALVEEEALDLRRKGTGEEARFHALRDRFSEYYEQGKTHGARIDLEIALALTQRLEPMAPSEEYRGWVLNGRGIALQTLGQREERTARLEAAVAAYRAALEVRTREAFPVDWAMTQNNLGNALQTLGEREEGTARLEEAVAAYRAALEVRTREAMPFPWAMTQNNLGAALRTLGQREEETAQLEAAVAVYRAALEVTTREAFPVQWASTQNNLGTALFTLGGREAGTERLEEAVAAYSSALQVRTREAFPLDWAATQNNLGVALRTLGEREEGTARLEAAVAAYRAALEVTTREAFPVDWASTQNNLGGALQILGQREEGTARLEAAVAAYRAVLEVYKREAFPVEWATTQNNLGAALQTLGQREEGTARLEEAVAAYSAALEVLMREAMPFLWAQTTENLGSTYGVWFEKTGDTTHRDQAIRHLRDALQVYEAAGAAYHIAKTREALARLGAED